MFRFGFADPAHHAEARGLAEQDQDSATGAPVDAVGAEEVLEREASAMAPSTVACSDAR